tara:strand:- start:23 stop:472 length:450 start_codon:yes stop_codon:yes gene_type:complete
MYVHYVENWERKKEQEEKMRLCPCQCHLPSSTGIIIYRNYQTTTKQQNNPKNSPTTYIQNTERVKNNIEQITITAMTLRATERMRTSMALLFPVLPPPLALPLGANVKYIRLPKTINPKLNTHNKMDNKMYPTSLQLGHVIESPFAFVS